MGVMNLSENLDLIIDGHRVYLNSSSDKDVKMIFLDKSGKPSYAFLYLMNKYLQGNEDHTSADISGNIYLLNKRFLDFGLFDVSDDKKNLNEMGIHILNQIVQYLDQNENTDSLNVKINDYGLYVDCLTSFEENPYEYETRIIPDSNVQSSSKIIVDDRLCDPNILSVSDIDLLIEHGLIKESVDGIEYTELGESHDLFKIIYGSRLDEAVVGVDEEDDTAGINPENKQGSLDSIEVEKLVEDGLKENYFKLLEDYEIKEWEKSSNQYNPNRHSIQFDGIKVPLTIQKVNKGNRSVTFATPEVYALGIIYEAYLKESYLDEERLNKVLEYYLNSATKYGMTVLRDSSASLVTFDENGGIHPGRYTESLLSIVSDFFMGGIDDEIQRPIGIEGALDRLGTIGDVLDEFPSSEKHNNYVEFRSSEIISDSPRRVSVDYVGVVGGVVTKIEPEISYGKCSWRKKISDGSSKPTVPFVSKRQEIEEDNPDDKFVSFDPRGNFDNPKSIVDENGSVVVVYGSFNGDGPQRKVISTSSGLTMFGERYIPSDVSGGDESSVVKLREGLSLLNLTDISGKLNGLGKELVDALGISSDVISLLDA